MEEHPGFWEVVESRRSVRRFTQEPVERSILERVVETGTRAPNAHNRQSWRFVVITDKEIMVRLAEQMSWDYRQALLNSGNSPGEVQKRVENRKARLTAAPVVLLLCVDTEDLDQYDDEHRSQGEYLMAVQSVALAAGHMLLSAHALGLAGVWMCAPLFAPEQVRAAAELPETWQAQGLLLLGYSAEEPKMRQRRPLDEVVRWN